MAGYCRRLAAALGLALAMIGTSTASAQPVSIKNPAAFVATLKAMGYAPGPLTNVETAPEVIVQIGGFGSTLRLAGCDAGTNCDYMTLILSFNDVVNPPMHWVQEMNDEFDLLRVGINENGQLYLFGAYVVEGLPQSELRRIFDYWSADTAAVGQEAVEGGYATKK